MVTDLLNNKSYIDGCRNYKLYRAICFIRHSQKSKKKEAIKKALENLDEKYVKTEILKTVSCKDRAELNNYINY